MENQPHIADVAKTLDLVLLKLTSKTPVQGLEARNNDSAIGYFEKIEDGRVMLRSVSSGDYVTNSFGIPLDSIKNYEIVTVHERDPQDIPGTPEYRDMLTYCSGTGLGR